MDKHSDFRISSLQVVDAWRILQFNRKTEKYFKEFIWIFFCRGKGAAIHEGYLDQGMGRTTLW